MLITGSVSWGLETLKDTGGQRGSSASSEPPGQSTLQGVWVEFEPPKMRIPQRKPLKGNPHPAEP